MTHQHRAGKQVIHRDVEEALNLRRVQIDEQRAVGAGGGQQVGNQLGADGHARAVLAILPGVSVVRNHHRDAGRRGALQRVNHHQQFHQVLIHRVAGRLNHEYVYAADVLEQLEINLAVGEALQLGLAHRNPDVPADLLGQRTVGSSAEQLETLVLTQIPRPFALGCGFGVLAPGFRVPRLRLFLCAAVLRRLLRPRLFFQCCCRSHFHAPSTSKLVGFGCFPVRFRFALVLAP